MIGKILLYLLGVVLLLFLIALRIPAYLRISYEQGELRVFAKYAWLSIPLFPKSEKERPQKPQNEQTAECSEQVNETKQKNKTNREQILYTLDVLPPVLLRALKRFGRRIRIEPLKVHVLVAASDPADTAILYGKIQSVLAAVLPTFHRHVKIRKQDIQIFPDFSEENMDFIVDAGIGIPPGDILMIALCTLGGILKWLIGFRKRATKEPGTKDNKRGTTAQAEKAA